MMGDSGSFHFGSLFASTDGSSRTDHWGHIKCRCHHHADEDAVSARTSGLHHNDSCLWSCCGAAWSDMLCKAGASSSLPGSQLDLEEPVPEKKEEKDRFKRYLPTFYNQELICLSCFKPYRNPVRLICGHSMCRDCLNKMVLYQKAAGSFSSRFRPGPVKGEDTAAGASGADDLKSGPLGNLRLRQMTRTQRRLLLADEKKAEESVEKSVVDDSVVICPVCSETSYVRTAVEDTETIEKMKELEKQRQNGVRRKCAFCTSAVLAGAQPEEAADATLICSTCGPICARHHTLLHIAGPPMFRCHEVNETAMDLLPLTNIIPHQYEICPIHGCEMDLYDKRTKKSLCEVCASAIGKGDVSSRIIRDEDKIAFLAEEEDKTQQRLAQEKKSKEERLLEQEKKQKQQVASLQEELDANLKKCGQIMETSEKLYGEGKLTREVEGLNEAREDLKKLFAESHEALAEMEKRTLTEMDNMIANADVRLQARYDAGKALLHEAQEAASRVSGISLDSPDVRAMIITRLTDIIKSLKNMEALPTEPLKMSNLLAVEKNPDAVKKLKLVNISPVEGGLFASIVTSGPSPSFAEPEPEPESQPAMEDDDTILDRIRARLKGEETESQRSRENGRYGSIRGSINSGMSDAMKREAIAAIIFDRGESVLSCPFEEIIMVSEVFIQKNDVDHILGSLSAPADFNREMRAIYAFLKETKAI